MNNKNKKAVLPYGENFQRILREIEREFPQKEYALEKLTERFEHLGREHKSEKEKLELLIRSAVELTEEIAPKWGKTFEFPVSGRTENRNETQKDSQLLRKDTISHRTRAVWRLYSGTLFQRGTQTGRSHAAAGTGQDFQFLRSGASAETLCDSYRGTYCPGNAPGNVLPFTWP